MPVSVLRFKQLKLIYEENRRFAKVGCYDATRLIVTEIPSELVGKIAKKVLGKPEVRAQEYDPDSNRITEIVVKNSL